MTRRLNIVLLVLTIVVGLPFYWLLLNTTTSDDTRPAVTMAQLRRVAGPASERMPIDVRYETLGERRIVSDLLAAGSGLRPVPYVIRAYQLILPDGGMITIDRGLSRTVAEAERLANFDPSAQGAVEAAVQAAGTSLTLGPTVQHSGFRTAPAGFGSGLGEGTVSGTAPYRVAPGVVVIPTPDVLPGARMVYVRLVDGTELIFAGDVAPTKSAWSQTRPPARLATSYLRPVDREAVIRWLRALSAWKAAAPQLEIVAGYDDDVPGALTRGFIAPADQSIRPPR